MVSFDVESLFTNIPLDDCINLAVKYITEGNPGLKLSKNELKRLFEFATKETHFLFKGNFYDQVDGVAMGSPLAPVVAIIGLSTSCSNFLKKLLKSCSKTLKVAQKLPQNPTVAQKLLSIF